MSRSGLKAYAQHAAAVSTLDKSKDEIFMEFQPRILSIARRLAERLPPSIPLAIEDLASYGAIGLLEAIERYNPSMNNQFNTFADYRIRGAMRDAIRSFDSMSRHRRDQDKQLRSTEEFLQSKLGRDPLPSEVAEELQITLSEYFHLKNNTMKVMETSVHYNSETKEEKILVELLAANGDDPLDLILNDEFRAGVRSAIDDLAERPRQCVLLYYGRNLNLTEIAEVFGITPSRVSQILSRARQHLMVSLRDLAEDAGYDVD